jgi:hypothetical protein
MIRLLTALACLVVAVSLVPAAPVPKHLIPKDPPLAIPTRVWTTWVYTGNRDTQTIVISEVKEEKDGAKLVTTEKLDEDGKMTPFVVERISAEGIFIVSEMGQKYDEPWCILKLPHRPGQTWETRLRGRDFDADGTMTAGPLEKVKVPLGEFSAARVDWEFKLNGARRKVTFWYAHGVGLVRQNENWELKSFTPGKE